MNAPITGSFVSRLSAEQKALALRAAAEGVSMIAATPGSVLVGDVLLRRPYGSVKEWFGTNVVLPNLKDFETVLARFPSIDSPEEREQRAVLAPEVRAKQIGDKMLDIFGLPMLMGWAGQFMAQSYGIKALGLQDKISRRENLLAFAGDKVVVAGAIGLLNYGMPEVSDTMQQGLTNMFRRAGLSDETSRNVAGQTVNWHLPNMLGLAASLGILNWALKR